MASKAAPKSLPVRGRASGALEGVAGKRWRHLERIAQALRSLGDTPMTQARAERLAQRFGVHWATIYRIPADGRHGTGTVRNFFIGNRLAAAAVPRKITIFRR